MSSAAVGVHAHPTFKLGLRPAEELPALQLADFLTGVVPAHPADADYLGRGTYGLYQNDRYGVCGPVSAANQRRLMRPDLPPPTQEDVFALYRASGNPTFDPASGRGDNGVVMQRMLQAMTAVGLGAAKPLGFARVDPSDFNEVEAAVALFGSILCGADLQTAQQSQTDAGWWDYQPSRVWGGHAVMVGAYKDDARADCITWGKRVGMSPSFVRLQVREAWVVLWPEHLQSDAFLKGVDVARLARAYEDLTGRPFPAAVPPTPTPTPPTPAGGSTVQVLIDGADAVELATSASAARLTVKNATSIRIPGYRVVKDA